MCSGGWVMQTTPTTTKDRYKQKASMRYASCRTVIAASGHHAPDDSAHVTLFSKSTYRTMRVHEPCKMHLYWPITDLRGQPTPQSYRAVKVLSPPNLSLK